MVNDNMQKLISDEINLINLLMISNEEERENLISVFKKNKIINPVFYTDDIEKAFAKLDEIYAKSKENTRSMILLDRNLPNGTAFGFLARLRNEYKLSQIEVFLMDTHDAKEIPDFKQLEISGLILKPVSFEGFAKGIAAKKLSWQLVDNVN